MAAGNLALADAGAGAASIARQALVRGVDGVMLYAGLCAWAFAGASWLVLGRNGR